MLLAPLALAEPLSWIPVGPERGHVMDVASAGDVYAVTRVGVMRADPQLTSWSRDPRFPARVRLIAADRATLWAATDAGLWRLDDRLTRLADLPAGLAVDLAAVPGGALVALRGAQAGIWRFDGTLVRVAEVDPWQIAVDGDRVLVATLDQGLWTSEDGGRTFAASAPGTVSAVAFLEGHAWAGWSDGRLLKDGVEACRLAGPPISLASIAGVTWAVVDSATGPSGSLARCGGLPRKVPPPDDDPVPFQPTGLWPLDDAHALLGSFRSGPLVLDADGVRPARTGFRATIGSDAVVVDNQLTVALASSGVYATSDQGTTWRHVAAGADPSQAPVTDTMDLLADKDRLFVLDFEGVTIGRGGRWYRSAGAASEGSGRHSGLLEIAQGEGSGLWGRDTRGGLWQLSGSQWTACSESGVLHLEGSGDSLLFATTRGWERPGPGCAGTPTGWTIPAADARASSGWVAAPGGLWHDGQHMADLPNMPVRALAVRGDEVLVGDAHGAVRLCTPACTQVGPTLSEGPAAVGWIGDTIWALESHGTLVLSGEGPALPALFDAGASASEPLETASGDVATPSERATLAAPPWRSVGRAVEAELPPPPDHLPVDRRALTTGTSSVPWTKIVIGLEVAALGVVAALVVRRAPRRRRRR